MLGVQEKEKMQVYIVTSGGGSEKKFLSEVIDLIQEFYQNH